MQELTEVVPLRRGLFSRSRKNAQVSRWLKARALPLALGALAICGAATAPSASAVTLNWSAVKEPGVGGAVTSIQVCPTDSNKIVVGGDMLGPTYSTDGGASWNDTYGLTNWECADSTWKPGSTTEVWMGTMGGPFKSTDGGRNWVSKRVGMPAPETYWGYNVPIQKVLYDPNNTNRLLAFGGTRRQWANGKATTAKFGSVWESTNGGDSWTEKSVIANTGTGTSGLINSAVFAPGSSTVIYAALRKEGVYKSTDGGATWTAKNNGLPTLTTDIVAVHPTDGNTLWWCGDGKRTVYKSTNGGDSWTFAGNGLSFDSNSDHSYSTITVSPTNPSVLYVVNGNWQQLFKSTDGGVNWTNTNSVMPDVPTSLGFQCVSIAVDPQNANTVYTNNSVTILKSTNAAGSWSDISSKPGSSTGLWQGRGYSGFVSTRVKWNPFNTSQVVLQAMDDGKFMQSTDMVNWRMHGSTMNMWHGGNDVSFGGTNGTTIYAALGQGTDAEPPAKSTDGGVTWNYVTNVGDGYSMSIYTLPSDTSKVWYVRGGRLYYSINSGSSWTEINVGGDTNLTQIIADNASTPNIYLASKSGAYKGTPSNSFTKVANVEWSENMRIALDPGKAGRFYLASYRYNQFHCGIYRVDNGTQTRINTNEYVYDVAVDPQNANRVVMITNHNSGVEVSSASGVWMTENALDANPTWTQQNTGLPMLRGQTIAIHPTNGTIIVGLNGRGFYKASTGGGSATPTPTPTPTSSTYKARFYPRANVAARMNGGKIQGSNTSSTSGFVDLATLTATPTENAWSEVGLGNTAYRYLRYMAPNGGYGNVAEVEFYNGTTKLTGTKFGTSGSWNNGTNTFDKAQDGNTSTFFDANVADGAYTGLDSGATTTPSNLVVNPSFDAQASDTQTPSGWSEWQYDSAWTAVTPNASFTESYGGSQSGARHGTHYATSSYRVYTYQDSTNLVNGLYTLRAYGRRSGSQTTCILEAKNFGSSKSAAFPVSSSYQLVEIKDINVTNGQATIGIWSDANAGDWVYFDDVEFFKQ